MSTLWFCGDSHGSLVHLQRAWERHGPVDAIVHLGDLDLEQPLSDVLSKDVAAVFWWIPGNHDFDRPERHQRLYADPLASRCLHAQVRQVGGQDIAGLGGHFQAKVWHPSEPLAGAPHHGLRQRDPSVTSRAALRRAGAIWPDQYAALAQQRAQILVTHEAPSSHPHGFAVLDALAIQMGVRLIVHGHHHQDLDQTIDEGRIRVLGVGFRGITDLEGRRVLASSSGLTAAL